MWFFWKLKLWIKLFITVKKWHILAITNNPERFSIRQNTNRDTGKNSWGTSRIAKFVLMAKIWRRKELKVKCKRKVLSEKLVFNKINISDCWKLRVRHIAYPYETNEKNIFLNRYLNFYADCLKENITQIKQLIFQYFKVSKFDAFNV